MATHLSSVTTKYILPDVSGSPLATEKPFDDLIERRCRLRHDPCPRLTSRSRYSQTTSDIHSANQSSGTLSEPEEESLSLIRA